MNRQELKDKAGETYRSMIPDISGMDQATFEIGFAKGYDCATDGLLGLPADGAERAQELWDEFSYHVEDSSAGFEDVAGTSVVTMRHFALAFAKTEKYYSALLQSKDDNLSKALNLIDEKEAEIIRLQERIEELEKHNRI